MLNPWFALTFKAIQLGIDAQNVIAPPHAARIGRHARSE